jgi:rubrerythrin
VRPCVLAEYPHKFVEFEGELRCEGCGYYVIDLIEDGECSACGEVHPESICDWTEGRA